MPYANVEARRENQRLWKRNKRAESKQENVNLPISETKTETKPRKGEITRAVEDYTAITEEIARLRAEHSALQKRHALLYDMTKGGRHGRDIDEYAAMVKEMRSLVAQLDHIDFTLHEKDVDRKMADEKVMKLHNERSFCVKQRALVSRGGLIYERKAASLREDGNKAVNLKRGAQTVLDDPKAPLSTQYEAQDQLHHALALENAVTKGWEELEAAPKYYAARLTELDGV